MGRTFEQGYYTPRHPQKYKGDVAKIFYRSSWELSFNKLLDNNPNVLEWSAEPFAIPYLKPTDGKVHRYFPDYWVKFKNKDGNILTEIIEIKPKKQTRASRARNPKVKLHEDLTYAINLAKWKSAKQFCDTHGLNFRIVSENQLFR